MILSEFLEQKINERFSMGNWQQAITSEELKEMLLEYSQIWLPLVAKTPFAKLKTMLKVFT